MDNKLKKKKMLCLKGKTSKNGGHILSDTINAQDNGTATLKC